MFRLDSSWRGYLFRSADFLMDELTIEEFLLLASCAKESACLTITFPGASVVNTPIRDE